jgi:ribosomal protein S27E
LLTTFQPFRVLLTSHRNVAPELASIDSSAENRHDMPSVFLTFRCRHCQQGRCVSAVWWDIRAINELKDKDFSARCADCGHQDVFFGIEAIEMYHGELSAIERMELDEEELREFGLDEEGENEE